MELSPQLVREAAQRIKPLARRTPVMTSRSIDERAGCRVFLKCENLQRGGAFKIRGASNLILSLSPGELERGVVAFSSGNHAQGTAIAAKHAGTRATVVMPEDAPRMKVEATRALGARIVTYDRLRDDREAVAARVLADNGGTLVPPFDHPMIMAGQGTAALELLEDIPDGGPEALLACVGGGGLLAGSATIAKSMRPGIRIFGVEPELANDTALSFAAGERVAISPPETIADGLRPTSPGKLTFPVILRHVEKILLVSEAEIRATVRFLLERLKILVEPSGAVPVAAVLFDRLPSDIRSAGVIISGGNTDFDFLRTLGSRGACASVGGLSIGNLLRHPGAWYPSGMVSWRVIGKLIGSAAFLALLTGFMWYFHIADYTFLAWALAGSLVIFLWTRPDFAGLTHTVLLSAVFALMYSLIRHEPVFGAALAFLGLGSIARLGLLAIWCSPAEREDYLATCLRASMFPLYMAIAGFSIAVTTIVHPKTYDLFLYAFDAQLGVSPSFLVGKTLARLGMLRQICYYGYESLPMAMAIAFALDGRKQRNGSGIMAAFTVAATGGFILYNLYPATGPLHVFGARFPFAPPAPMLPPFEFAAGISAPRNAMPSVHFTLALLILWNSRRWAAGWRILAAVLLALTILATLGLGEHYLVDLFVAVPFSLLAQGVAASGIPWYSRQRIAAIGGGGALVAAWIVYLRLPSPPLHANGLRAWALLAATAGFGVWMESRLNRASGNGYGLARVVEAVTAGENALATTV